MTGQGGWPLNVFAHARAGPVLRRDVLPAAAAPRAAELAPGAAGGRRRLAHPPRRDPRAGRADGAAAGRRRAAAPGGGDRCAPRRSTTPSRRCAGPSTASTAAGAARRSSRRRPWSSCSSRRGETTMSLFTLRSMASGGIFDQVGGGFHRYSIDATWTVPHFEKMLYDNALLARAYVHAWQLSGDPVLRRTAEETLDWAQREMAAPRTAGSAAPWTPTPRASRGESTSGRSTSCARSSVPTRPRPSPGSGRRRRGTSARGPRRQRPGVARARARRGHPRPDPRRPPGGPRPAPPARARRQAADELERAHGRGAGRRRGGARPPRLRRRGPRDGASSCSGACATPDGRLLRTYNAGQAKIDAYLEDHAFLLEALLVLYEATFEERWFAEARTLADAILERFADAEHGGFFSTAADDAPLVARRKDLEDAPIPAGGLGAALGPAAAGRAQRRGRARGARGRAAAPPRGARAAAPDGVRAPAAGPGPAPAPGQRGRRRRPGGRARAARRRLPRALRPRSVLAGGPGRARARSRCSRRARRSRAGRPPTCAGASPAGAR